jgi:hypothetical protein
MFNSLLQYFFEVSSKIDKEFEVSLGRFIAKHPEIFIVGFCALLVFTIFLGFYLKKLAARLRDVRILVIREKEAKGLLQHKTSREELMNIN